MSMLRDEEILATVEETRSNLIDVFDSFEHIWISEETSVALIECLAALSKFQRHLEEDILVANADEVLETKEKILLKLRLMDE